MILGKILAMVNHETSGKILARDDRDATARPFRGHLWGHNQAHICKDSTTVPI